jgi:serine/threonine-protein kinase ATR
LQLDTIAADFGTNTSQLLQPYWRVIAFSVIKDYSSRPQKIQYLAELTEQSVRQLLLLTQADTLPHLVLTKRKDIIEKIAQARKASVGEVMTQPKRNLAKTLALLLCQATPDVERSAMDALAAIEPAIREGSNNKLEALIAADITGVAIEILVLAADQDESNKKPVRVRLKSKLSSLIIAVPSWIRHPCNARRDQARATQVYLKDTEP